VERCVDSPDECLSPPDRNDEDDPDRPGAAPGGGKNPPPDGDPFGADPRGTGTETPAGSVPSAPAGTQAGDSPAHAPVSSETPNLLERIGRGLIDVAQRFPFPLALGASVAVFLLMQSRIDGKDPKLAAAPVDARDDLVIFE
jgi:hypothetical protein